MKGKSKRDLANQHNVTVGVVLIENRNFIEYLTA